MPGDFPFSIWKIAVFNSRKEIFCISFSFISLVIFGLIDCKSSCCNSELVCLLDYKLTKKVSLFLFLVLQ